MQNHKIEDGIKWLAALIFFFFLLPYLVISCEEQQYKDWKYEYEEQRINNR